MTPKTIFDEFYEVESRQVRYQKRRQMRGECVVCGKPRLAGDSRFCAVHREARRCRDRVAAKLRYLKKKIG